ncbi:hypothetical protein [Amycolatopsis vancoresmycina]|nr:hypothetical protein [Amycolatopsis vancoresmycina]
MQEGTRRAWKARVLAPVLALSAVAALGFPAAASAAPVVSPAGPEVTAGPAAKPEPTDLKPAFTTMANRPISRSEVRERGQSWLDDHVPYSQSAYHTNQYGSYRQDCSGFVSMAWNLERSENTQSLLPLMTDIDRSDLKFGDALWRTGHIALFVGWNDEARTRPVVWEEYDYGHFAEQRVWSASYAATFTAKRYRNIVEDAPPPPDAGISVGSDGTQLILNRKGNGTALAKKGIGLYGWTVETDPVVKKVATNGGVQLILTKDGTVLAKDTIGLYEWTVETDAVVTDIAVGSDGTQMILDNTGTVLAKKGIGLYGWTVETDAVVKQIATNGGVQLILDNTGTVLAKNSIGQYGWTRETDAVVGKIAVGSDGTQLILDNTGTVSAKDTIGLYGWTAETDAVVTDIAAGSDGTQMILDRTGTVLAKDTIGLYGWTVETDAVVDRIATNGGVQLILDRNDTVLAKTGIGLYGWTLESDSIV